MKRTQHFIVATAVISRHTETFMLSFDLDSRNRTKKKLRKMGKEWSHNNKQNFRLVFQKSLDQSKIF